MLSLSFRPGAFLGLKRGFTLAEVLIALALLGVIATITIPKIISGQQNSTYNASAKEAVSMITGAYQRLQQDTTPSGTTKASDLLPYMNYVKTDTSTMIDNVYTGGNIQCLVARSCIRLHNGSMLMFYDPAQFAGTSSTNAIWFVFDPDGQADSTTNGPAKAVDFALFYDGRVTSWGGIKSATVSSDGTRTQNIDPPWFSW